jgi:hypothetical protein
MDLLVLENFIASKKEITRLPSAAEKAEHLAAFQPD